MDSQFVHTFSWPYLTWKRPESSFDIPLLSLCLLPSVKLMQNEIFLFFIESPRTLNAKGTTERDWVEHFAEENSFVDKACWGKMDGESA